jgi:hypothetical protein
MVGYFCYSKGVKKCVHDLLQTCCLALSYEAVRKTMKNNAARAPTAAEVRARLGMTLIGTDNGQRTLRVPLPHADKKDTILHFAASVIFPLPEPTEKEIEDARVCGTPLTLACSQFVVGLTPSPGSRRPSEAS